MSAYVCHFYDNFSYSHLRTELTDGIQIFFFFRFFSESCVMALMGTY